MNHQKVKAQKLLRRKVRSRIKHTGSAQRPRLSVNRSLKGITAQLIDDVNKVTLVAASLKDLADVSSAPDTKLAMIEGIPIERTKELQAFRVGLILAERAQVKKIDQAIFDRSGRAYAGRIRALAEGARAGGLKF
jgi:large subunit ribosomal protein L18